MSNRSKCLRIIIIYSGIFYKAFVVFGDTFLRKLYCQFLVLYFIIVRLFSDLIKISYDINCINVAPDVSMMILRYGLFLFGIFVRLF